MVISDAEHNVTLTLPAGFAGITLKFASIAGPHTDTRVLRFVADADAQPGPDLYVGNQLIEQGLGEQLMSVVFA